jgi:hypothetical protein
MMLPGRMSTPLIFMIALPVELVGKSRGGRLAAGPDTDKGLAALLPSQTCKSVQAAVSPGDFEGNVFALRVR